MSVPTARRADRVVARLERGAVALELLDERWDALLARQEIPNPTLSAAWLRELARWRTGVPLVAVAEADGRLVAGAALELRGGRRPTPRVATWLGPVEQQFSPDMLADPAFPHAAESLVGAILEEAGALSIGTPGSGTAARALAAVAPWRRAVVTGERWLLPWPAPRLAYARSRAGRDLRRTAGRGVRAELVVMAEPEDVKRALVRLFRLHRERWRDRPDETPRFATTRAHRLWNLRAMGALAEAGRVRVAELLEDGRLVAGNVGLVYGRGAVGHTQAIRSGGVSREPGHVLMLTCLEALAAAGASVIDVGVSSGEAGGPKARLGAIADPFELILATGSPARQHAYESAQRLRGTVRALRRVKARRS